MANQINKVSKEDCLEAIEYLFVLHILKKNVKTMSVGKNLKSWRKNNGMGIS